MLLSGCRHVERFRNLVDICICDGNDVAANNESLDQIRKVDFGPVSAHELALRRVGRHERYINRPSTVPNNHVHKLVIV